MTKSIRTNLSRRARALVAVAWFPIAYLLGKRYEAVRGEGSAAVQSAPARAH